jgi:hypothetical protein
LFTQHFKGAMFGLGSGIDTPTTIRLWFPWRYYCNRIIYFFSYKQHITNAHNSTIELNTTAYQKNLSFLRTTFWKKVRISCVVKVTLMDMELFDGLC